MSFRTERSGVEKSFEFIIGIPNSKIFTNVLRIAEPNDRIIVLYGAAHIHSLKTMFGDSYDFDVEELSALLDAVK